MCGRAIGTTQFRVCVCVYISSRWKKYPSKTWHPSTRNTTIICHNDHYATGQRCVEISLSRFRRTPTRPFSRWRTHIPYNIIYYYICVVLFCHSDVMMDARSGFGYYIIYIDNMPTNLPFGDEVSIFVQLLYTSYEFDFSVTPSFWCPSFYRKLFTWNEYSFSWSIGFSRLVFNKRTTYPYILHGGVCVCVCVCVEMNIRASQYDILLFSFKRSGCPSLMDVAFSPAPCILFRMAGTYGVEIPNPTCA